MSGENDVFSVLGKVEVDLNALRASLAQAENLVTASTQKQAKTYEDFALRAKKAAHDAAMASATGGGPFQEGAYAAKYGGGAEGGGGGGTIHSMGEAAKTAGEHVQKLHHGLLTTAGGIRGFTHVVNTAIPGMGGMASGILTVGRHLGHLGVIVIAAAIAFAIWHQRMAQGKHETYEMGRALQTLDFERLNTMVKEANELLAKQADLTKRAGQEITGIGSILDIVGSFWKKKWTEITKLPPVETLDKTRDAWISLYNSIGGQGGKAALANQMAIAKAMEAAAQFALRLAGTSDTVTTAYDKLGAAQRKAHDATIAQIEADRELRIKENEAAGDKKKLAAINVEFDEKRARADEALALQQAESAQDRLKRLAELATAEVETANKIIDATHRQEQSFLQLRKTQIDSEEQLAQARAKALGYVVSGEGAIKARFGIERAEIEKTEEAEQTKFLATEANLKKQIADGLDVARNEQELSVLRANREADRVMHRDKIKEVSTKKDVDLTLEAQRVYESAIQQTTRMTEAYFGLRRSMGYDTIHAEIAAQVELNKAYVQGSEEYFNGQKRVYDLQKQARSEAKSAAEQAINVATDALKKQYPGRTKFSRSEIEAAYKGVQREDQTRFRAFGRNEQVDTGELLKGMGRQAGFEKYESMTDQGRTLSGMFEEAVRKPFRGYEDATVMFKDSVTIFAEAILADKASRPAGGMQTASVDEYLKDPSANRMSENIGRQNYLEGKRGPAGNPSVA